MTRKTIALIVLAMITGLVLVACQPNIVEVTRIVKETVIETVEETVIIEGTPVVQEVTKVVEVEKEVLVTPTPEPEPKDPSSSPDEPAFGGTLNIAWTVESGRWIDLQTSADDTTRDNMVHVMETLVTVGEDYSVVPMLAKSWEITDDGKTYTFYLREGIKFHDGTDFTSEDVIASIDRYLEVGCRKDSLMNLLDSYEAVDDYTIVMNIKNPSVAFLDVLASPACEISIYPKEIITGRPDDLKPEEIVGTGPYRVVDIVYPEYVHLARFEDYQPYPGERNGAGGAKIAYFDEIIWHTVPEYSAEFAGVQTGEYDLLRIGEWSSAPIVEADPNVQMLWNLHRGDMFISINFDNPVMNDLKLRQALQVGLDLEALAIASVGGCTECYDMNPSLWPKFSSWYIDDAEVKDLYNQHDVEKAKELLAESSYDGEVLEIVTASHIPTYFGTAFALSDQMQQLGLNTKVTVLTGAAYGAYVRERKHAINFAGLMTPILVSPEWFMTYFNCEPTIYYGPYYCDEDMEATLAALGSASSIEDKKSALAGLQSIVFEDVVNILISQIGEVSYARSDIRGYEGWYINRYFGVWRQK